MELKYKTCNKCGFSYTSQMNDYRVGSFNFCSSSCIPQCSRCYSKNTVIYCNINNEYYCRSCEQERCQYCNLFKKGYKCANKCE